MKKYAEYKDSSVTWIGCIPSHWGTRRLRHLGIARNGLTYSPDDIVEDGIKVLRSSNIQNNALDFNDTVFIQMRVPSNLILKEGDLLICSRNGSRELIGKCALIDKENEGNTYGAFMCVFRSKYNRFIQKVFQGDVFDYYLATFTTATINQLTNSNLYNIQIPFPPDREQEAIVEYLDQRTRQIDALIADLQSQVEMLDRYKRELVAEAVTKGLNKSTTMKDSGVEWIGEIPSHWKITKNKWLFRKVKNIVGCGQEKYPVLSLSIKGVIEKDREDNTGKIPTQYEDYYQIVECGNLLLCLFDMDVTPCIVGYIPQDGIVSPAYSHYTSANSKSASMRFYYWWFLYMQHQRLFVSLSNNIRNSINAEHFGSMPSPQPPIDEQEKIAEYLEKKTAKIEGLIADITAQIEKLKQYRQIVIHDAVTGKIKIAEG